MVKPHPAATCSKGDALVVLEPLLGTGHACRSSSPISSSSMGAMAKARDTGSSSGNSRKPAAARIWPGSSCSINWAASGGFPPLRSPGSTAGPDGGPHKTRKRLARPAFRPHRNAPKTVPTMFWRGAVGHGWLSSSVSPNRPKYSNDWTHHLGSAASQAPRTQSCPRSRWAFISPP